MDRIYRIDIAGLSFAQDGIFNSLRGASSILGGRLVGPVRRADQRFRLDWARSRSRIKTVRASDEGSAFAGLLRCKEGFLIAASLGHSFFSTY